MQSESCIGEIKKEYPHVYPELVNRQEIPTSVLLKEAMQRRGLEYNNELKLEDNCMTLLDHLGLKEQLQMEIEEEKENQVAHEIEDILMQEEEPEEAREKKEEIHHERPPMKEPDFLVPVRKHRRLRKFIPAGSKRKFGTEQEEEEEK